MPLRFNHMELSLPPGELTRWRKDIASFYGEVFGFTTLDFPLFGQDCLVLQTDPEASQFLLVVEHERSLSCPGFDHLGFLLDSREAVDEKLIACRAWQKRDSRVVIKEYDDLVLEHTTTRAFYVRFGLPIWFDVQHIAYSEDTDSKRRWVFQ
jgi:hypothetical protein